MAGKYVLKKASDGQYMFNLKAGNGETILTSERYVSKSGAQNGIESVKANSSIDGRYERKTGSGNQPYYFVLKAANSEVIGTSELYGSAAARDKGIESVKANGPSATIDDQS